MPLQNKKRLSERDICTKFITPALTRGGKWDIVDQVREEVSLTKGRVIVRFFRQNPVPECAAAA